MESALWGVRAGLGFFYVDEWRNEKKSYPNVYQVLRRKKTEANKEERPLHKVYPLSVCFFKSNGTYFRLELLSNPLLLSLLPSFRLVIKLVALRQIQCRGGICNFDFKRISSVTAEKL